MSTNPHLPAESEPQPRLFQFVLRDWFGLTLTLCAFMALFVRLKQHGPEWLSFTLLACWISGCLWTLAVGAIRRNPLFVSLALALALLPFILGAAR